jgi:hypothetical protein
LFIFSSFFLDKYVSPITLFTQNCSQERMTLKHKNTSRWTRRIKKRGLSVQDEGTQAAIAAQLQQHALLTRKMNSMNDGSSRSDESSDEEEESESEVKLLNRGKEKILRVLEEDNEIPNLESFRCLSWFAFIRLNFAPMFIFFLI